MNDLKAALELYATSYRSRHIPPPHMLFVGSDDLRNLAVATDFASRLGVKIGKADAREIEIQGDLTAAISSARIVFIGNIQRLKKSWVEKLERSLSDGEFEISIGKGPAARIHKIEISATTVIATCPTKYDCPSQLLKVFGKVFTIDPPTDEELAALLEQEAWKDKIELNRDASELLVRVGGGRTDLMLRQFRRVCGVIDQLKMTSRPQLAVQEIIDALERLRIDIPPSERATGPFDIHALSGQEFEYVIKTLLTEMGFKAELTERTGDGGIDIIAKLDKPFVGGRYLFQCKRYGDGNMVGAPEVRDFYGAVMADRAVKGIFITTSDFTNQAKEFASQSGIEIVNLSKLLQLFEDNGLNRYL